MGKLSSGAMGQGGSVAVEEDDRARDVMIWIGPCTMHHASGL